MLRMKTAYKFRMYPNKRQKAQLELTLETCRYLYNLALADRKNAYEVEGISRSYEDQAAMLTVERNSGNFKGIYAHCLQDVLRRLDKSFKAFFRRVKSGEKPGYPRFKGMGWYKSFTYPDSETGYKLEGSKLALSKIGSIRIFKHREVEGKIKTCTIKKDLLGHWYATLVAEVEDIPPDRVEDRYWRRCGLEEPCSTFHRRNNSISKILCSRLNRNLQWPKGIYPERRKNRPIGKKPKPKSLGFIRRSRTTETNSYIKYPGNW